MAAPNEMTSYRAPENTDLHTRLAGASEPEYSKLPTDITTAGVNLVGLSLELLTLSLTQTHTHMHTLFPNMDSTSASHFFFWFSFWPWKVELIRTAPGSLVWMLIHCDLFDVRTFSYRRLFILTILTTVSTN